MTESAAEKLFMEGIKERIEDLTEDDMYYAYGRLIAEGKLELSMECVSNSAQLASVVCKYRQGRKNTLDW